MRSPARPTLSWLLAVLPLLSGPIGCGLKLRTPPPGFEPLDATNQAVPPTSTTEAHPELLNIVKGHDDTNDFDWAEAQGFVHASVAEVAAALQDANVLADRRQLTSWSSAANTADTVADDSFTINCVTKQLSLTYVVGWRELATQGTKSDPVVYVARSDLLKSASVLGMDVMGLLSDSIVLGVVDPTTTSFAMIRHRNSLQSSPADAAQYVNDVYASVVAKVHGNPLPTLK
jgi:hypothetical protein